MVLCLQSAQKKRAATPKRSYPPVFNRPHPIPGLLLGALASGGFFNALQPLLSLIEEICFLAAVGNSYEITLIFIAFAFGCNIGCSVIVSQLFGAKHLKDMKTAVYTTLISVCVLAMVVVFRRFAKIETEGKAKPFSWRLLVKIAAVAVPSILQQSFISVGNIIIQGIINDFGSSVIAGYAASVKLNNLVITSLTTLGNGVG